ncbi:MULTISPECIES: hypothetical protein [Psychrilyobacter]|uniref:Uncharacterized protein n=1 Tax=Psychrilyobacter piezotolerans TaxID=2293438 RepID=A0ABX9KDU0_9FUSO|nr:MULTISPECIES: hypothetical protein [Psychrilyobacter]MCS5423084.1 hypothetical protein [Psychrilyobacter sp. S5]NDI79152.1 hypothetical protein [Psychrilyobacter piezotolerans]RDE58950.1 hypothetical protein DV867_14645 [Psychrilyobacter sp. S5]REI39506.1 hypothetical protein DYH56_14645 [Psychrilyobacter piezotolerans]
MENIKVLEKYSKTLKKELKKKLKSGLEINSVIYPVEKEGAVFEFTIDKTKKSKRIERKRRSVNEVVSNSSQNIITGNINSASFSGTNIIMNKNKITIIKGGNEKEEWNNKQIEKDIRIILGDKK